MTSRTLVVLVMLLGTAVTFAAPIGPQRDTRQQQVIVSVLDRDGKTAAGVKPAEVAVREDGVSREVLRVEPTSAPMQVVLLVDTSDGMQSMVQDLRLGMHAFAQALWATNPSSEVALMEFGERSAQLADYTQATNLLDRGLARLAQHSGSGAYFLDAIIDATKSLKKHEAKRPVIVAFVREASPEYSSRLHQEIETALKDVHATLWVIVLQGLRGSNPSSESHEREVVMGDVTTESGGARDVLLDRVGIEHEYRQLADRLTSQYAITYGRPDSLIPPTQLEVTVKRAGTHIVAPHWTGE